MGQGDATVLAAGDGTGVVVDAGPDPALVDRCLSALGVDRIPLVVLTHFHADHVAGLPGVLRGRSVGAIETTGFEEPPDQVEFVRAQAAVRHIPLTRAAAGEQRRAGALDWRVLWPPSDRAPAPDGPNDASVTLLVRSAGLSLLLLGDLEPPAQQALLRSPAAAGLGSVDVLKVAHHGFENTHSLEGFGALGGLPIKHRQVDGCGTPRGVGHADGPDVMRVCESGYRQALYAI